MFYFISDMFVYQFQGSGGEVVVEGEFCQCLVFWFFGKIVKVYIFFDGVRVVNLGIVFFVIGLQYVFGVFGEKSLYFCFCFWQIVVGNFGFFGYLLVIYYVGSVLYGFVVFCFFIDGIVVEQSFFFFY